MAIEYDSETDAAWWISRTERPRMQMVMYGNGGDRAEAKLCLKAYTVMQ